MNDECYWKAHRNEDGSISFCFKPDKAIPLDASESQIGACAVIVEMKKDTVHLLTEFLSLGAGSSCEYGLPWQREKSDV